MTDTADTPARELLEERRSSFLAFEVMVIFAALHIAFTLACLGLAFFGGAKGLALLLWIGGSLAMLVGVFIRGVRRDV